MSVLSRVVQGRACTRWRVRVSRISEMMIVCLTADAMVSYHMACIEFLYIVDCRRSATAAE